ncbi:tetratricopeptide (TPR) repeat protein [Nocardiopsis algeriensis]|uniref:Tetratricopeptide (TPR) repeat protein n=2 Tax=Nocardiopsis algeriensis TaxID=1478215 RepID=A0A841IVZ6_9ACTN|nr:tetratricopeptide (TPR) repeat protein [Nocardiopsis algeriensis]
MAWTNLGTALQQLRRFDEAIDAHTRAQQTFHQVGDAHREAMAWLGLGLDHANAGAREEAVKALSQAVPLFEVSGDDHTAAAVRDLIAQIQGNPD